MECVEYLVKSVGIVGPFLSDESTLLGDSFSNISTASRGINISKPDD